MAPQEPETPLAPWTRVATTYVKCSGDRANPPHIQARFARPAHHVVELPTGHSPFLSRPDLVVNVLAGIAEAIGDG